jgi:hypothetical protein
MSLFGKLKERRLEKRQEKEKERVSSEVANTIDMMVRCLSEYEDPASYISGGEGLLRLYEDTYISCFYKLNELIPEGLPPHLEERRDYFNALRLKRIDDRTKKGIQPFGRYDKEWKDRGLSDEEVRKLYEEQLSRKERDTLINERYGKAAPLERPVTRSITELSSFTVHPEGFIEGDAVIETQLHPKLVKYYRKYCSYATITADAAWGHRLTEPPITINLAGKSYKAMSLIEWLKRKAANCLTFQSGKIGPPPGQEGDIVCQILAFLTLASFTSDRELGPRLVVKAQAVLEANLDVLQKIDAVEDMGTCIKEIQDERSEV